MQSHAVHQHDVGGLESEGHDGEDIISSNHLVYEYADVELEKDGKG